MPSKINIGLSKKLGLPDFGSVGASCHVELELPHDAMSDLEAFHRHVRNSYAACRQAVHDQLAREMNATASNNGTAMVGPATVVNGTNSNGSPANANGNHNGKRPVNGRKATASQIRAIHAIINRQGLDLVETLRDRHGVEYAEDLGIAQASQLIDDLKAQASGTGGRR